MFPPISSGELFLYKIKKRIQNEHKQQIQPNFTTMKLETNVSTDSIKRVISLSKREVNNEHKQQT